MLALVWDMFCTPTPNPRSQSWRPPRSRNLQWALSAAADNFGTMSQSTPPPAKIDEEREIYLHPMGCQYLVRLRGMKIWSSGSAFPGISWANSQDQEPHDGRLLSPRYIFYLLVGQAALLTYSRARPVTLFTAYILHRTKLHPAVTFAALFRLQRLRGCFPSANSGHRLFILTYMISLKRCATIPIQTSHGTSSLRACLLWGRSTRRDAINCLDWELTVDNPIFTNFEQVVNADFRETCPAYLNHLTTFVSKRRGAARSKASTPINRSRTARVRYLPLVLPGTHRRPRNRRPRRRSPRLLGLSIPTTPIPLPQLLHLCLTNVVGFTCNAGGRAQKIQNY